MTTGFIFSDSIKEPAYSLISSDNNIEIREYGEYVIAKTEMLGGKRSTDNNMFRVLANYIFGGNSSNASIPMTAPVITKESSSSYSMIFFMLQANSPEDMPSPNSDNISIDTISLGKAVAIKFGMWVTEDRVEYYENILNSYVRENNIQVTSELMVAQYNSPWTVPPFRRNELIYKIK